MPKRKKTTASKQKVTKDVVKKAKPGQKTTASKQEVTNDVVKKAKHEQTEKQSNSTITSGGDTSVVPSKSISDSHRQPFSFYDIPCEDLAKSLLGQKLVHVVDKKRLTGVIVETEAYLGPIDKGAHSYEGKRTAKNEAMFMPPGTAYVYNIYGMYCCMNISAKGDGAAVLLRALEPVENLDEMAVLRNGKKDVLLKNDGRGLGNGPSKLCQALGIKKDAVNGVDLCSAENIWVEKGEEIEENNIVKCKRINIDYAGEWKDKPLRFYILGNKFNSVKDKQAEESMTSAYFSK